MMHFQIKNGIESSQLVAMASKRVQRGDKRVPRLEPRANG